MKVAALQMVSGVTCGDNLRSAEGLIQQAAEQGAEVAVLPEYFCILCRVDTDKLAVKESLGQGPIQEMLARCAKHHKIWIVGGTLPLSVPGDPNRVFNATLVFNPSGECVVRYDKLHLFRFNNGVEHYDESNTLLAGESPSVFDVPSQDGNTWRIGLSICYDLRFPELYRKLSDLGSELILVPSAFTHTTGAAHWEVLLRARAIENQVWVLAAAQGGVHENARKTWGQSMIINPWGQIVCELPLGPGCCVFDIDKDELKTTRRNLPALEHRRRL